ncbi:hypothetical protein A9976_27535 [Delftia sp. UME58]|nr:hypothetical protein [Delftia sp. UME58]
MVLCCLDQVLAALVQQSAVGGIHDHLLRAGLLGQYGFSAQVFTTVSSEASKVCCRYSSPAIRRGGKAGRPHTEVNETANERSTSGQSINAASLTSG